MSKPCGQEKTVRSKENISGRSLGSGHRAMKGKLREQPHYWEPETLDEEYGHPTNSDKAFQVLSMGIKYVKISVRKRNLLVYRIDFFP